MRKTLIFILLGLVVWTIFSCATEYVAYEERIFKYIEDTLESGAPDIIDLNTYIDGYPRDVSSSIIGFLIYDKQRQAFRERLLEYNEAVAKHNDEVSKQMMIAQVKEYMVQSYKEQVYKQLVTKYVPVSEYGQLTQEQQQKFLFSVVGERRIYKSEWDSMISQYHVLASRSVSEARTNKGEVKIKEALSYLMAQEALWYFGYVNRWTSDMEYSYMLNQIKDARMRMIFYIEGRDIDKEIEKELSK